MGTSIRGKSPHEADTRTTVGHGPGVGRGRRVRAEETFRGYANPDPSRCSLLYTSRTVHGAGVRRFHIFDRKTGGLSDGEDYPA
jgi:hypothetical protein